jgi:hypothetical protein
MVFPCLLSFGATYLLPSFTFINFKIAKPKKARFPCVKPPMPKDERGLASHHKRAKRDGLLKAKRDASLSLKAKKDGAPSPIPPTPQALFPPSEMGGRGLGEEEKRTFSN